MSPSARLFLLCPFQSIMKDAGELQLKTGMWKSRFSLKHDLCEIGFYFFKTLATAETMKMPKSFARWFMAFNLLL